MSFTDNNTTNNSIRSTRFGLEAPTMSLMGHKGAVYSARFNNDGNLVATGGVDKDILIWSIFKNCENIGALKGHKNAVLQLQWSKFGDLLFSCGADNNAIIWDVNAMEKVKCVKSHDSVINSISPSPKNPNLYLTGSNDYKAKLWDARKKGAISTFTSDYPVTAVALSSSRVIVGGVDNSIRVFESRKSSSHTLIAGAIDTISSLSVDDNDKNLLSFSLDNQLRLIDISPYSSKKERVFRKLSVPSRGMETLLLRANWGPTSTSGAQRVCAGSSDNHVYVFNGETGEMEFRLPGHAGTVTEADLSPTQNVVVSCGVDGKVFVGEI